MPTDVNKIIKKHQKLIQSDNMQVSSHVQREEGDWFINTLMIEGYDVPFRYKRKELYRKLDGGRVNMTYYPVTETVAGMEFEIMKVVRIRVT